MTQLELFRENLKEYAKDIRLNLSTLLTPEGASGLTDRQIRIVALACSYAARSRPLAEAILADSTTILTDSDVAAAKGAATIMAMNNVYYRTQHLAENAELKKLPARLRMNLIGKPGIERVEFELACLAVSAIAGCGACVNSHVGEVMKAALGIEAVQSAIRLGATVQAAALAEWIG
jgi:alkyl hydroperoxide reductase subunit D